MIARLQGSLVEIGLGEVIVDVSGVGYQLFVPDSTLHALSGVGEDVILFVHTHVREDAIQLYGFRTRSEKRLFETVVGVGGIGPRLALSILSYLAPEDFARAVVTNDGTALTKIPGIGKKTAARILLELKDKLSDWPQGAESNEKVALKGDGVGNSLVEDAVAALLTLGYGEREAQDAVELARGDDNADLEAEALIREALKRLDRTV